MRDVFLRLILPERRWQLRYALSVAAMLAVAVVKLALPQFGSRGPDLFLTIPVAVSAVLAGLGPALVATVGCTLLAAYFTPPPGFAVAPADTVDVAGFFVEGLIIGLLGAGLRSALGTALESLRQRDEMERERSALIAMVNHELRNPLASLSGNLQLAARYFARDEMRERVPGLLDGARHQITRLLRLADDLLVISRSTETFEVAPVALDLGAAVEAAALRAAANDPQRTIPLTLPPLPVFVTADPTRLDQILDNLLVNALKYTPRSAPVEILASMDPRTGRGLARVRDHGGGIPVADREHIFERFARGSGSGAAGGMGLGLYVSRELAMRMGGRVLLEESSDKGSTFAVELPVVSSVPSGEVVEASV
jgi:signal transduction histidine kinase